jgi:hypothetical protein
VAVKCMHTHLEQEEVQTTQTWYCHGFLITQFLSCGFKTEQTSWRFEVLKVASLKFQVFWNVIHLLPDILNGDSGWASRWGHNDASKHQELPAWWQSGTF